MALLPNNHNFQLAQAFVNQYENSGQSKVMEAAHFQLFNAFLENIDRSKIARKVMDELKTDYEERNEKFPDNSQLFNQAIGGYIKGEYHNTIPPGSTLFDKLYEKFAELDDITNLDSGMIMVVQMSNRIHAIERKINEINKYKSKGIEYDHMLPSLDFALKEYQQACVQFHVPKLNPLFELEENNPLSNVEGLEQLKNYTSREISDKLLKKINDNLDSASINRTEFNKVISALNEIDDKIQEKINELKEQQSNLEQHKPSKNLFFNASANKRHEIKQRQLEYAIQALEDLQSNIHNTKTIVPIDKIKDADSLEKACSLMKARMQNFTVDKFSLNTKPNEKSSVKPNGLKSILTEVEDLVKLKNEELDLTTPSLDSKH